MVGHVEPDPNAHKSFYTSVGTAVHTVFQRWLGSKGRIHGNWACRNSRCRKVVKFSHKNKCPRCKSEMDYVEFEVRAFKHVSGHTDGLYEDLKAKFWVIDYKTSSVEAITAHKKNPRAKKFPYPKNKSQITAYVPLLERQLGIKIEGWMLIYVARDNPNVFAVVGGVLSEKDKRAILKQIKGYDAQFDVVENLSSTKDLRFLVDHKFCKDREHYIEEMKAFNACPLESVCFTNQLSRILRESFEDYKENCK